MRDLGNGGLRYGPIDMEPLVGVGLYVGTSDLEGCESQTYSG